MEKEAEDWEREAEEEWKAKCEQIRKEVMSMTKKQLQQCLINQRIWEEEQKRNRW